MIESGGTAPYAPTGAVTGVIHAYRDRPIPTPINTDVIERIGVPASIAPRTLQALKLLDLLDADGTPTPAMEDLRKVGADEFPSRLADVVRAAYADVFTYRDPTTDDPSKIEDAFRSYDPVGMRPRMVTLFLGLCQEAGIIEEKPGRAAKATNGQKPAARERRPRITAPKPQPRVDPPTPKPAGAVPGADHLVIRGLLQTLPPVGTVFSDASRKEWADAVLAAFNLIYVRAPKDSEPRVTITPSSEEGSNH